MEERSPEQEIAETMVPSDEELMNELESPEGWVSSDEEQQTSEESVDEVVPTKAMMNLVQLRHEMGNIPTYGILNVLISLLAENENDSDAIKDFKSRLIEEFKQIDKYIEIVVNVTKRVKELDSVTDCDISVIVGQPFSIQMEDGNVISVLPGDGVETQTNYSISSPDEKAAAKIEESQELYTTVVGKVFDIINDEYKKAGLYIEEENKEEKEENE
jgi:hypothetical protein